MSVDSAAVEQSLSVEFPGDLTSPYCDFSRPDEAQIILIAVNKKICVSYIRAGSELPEGSSTELLEPDQAVLAWSKFWQRQSPIDLSADPPC